MATAASIAARLRRLHSGFASVTDAQVTAIWTEVEQRSGGSLWGDTLATALTLMAAHLIALGPMGDPGAGVGVNVLSSSSSGLSVAKRYAQADARNGDLDQTVWGQRWLGLVASQPRLSAPVILF